MNENIQKIIKNSGKKACQICQNLEILIEHHINGRDIENYNAFWNKSYICSNCHTKIHRGIIIIEGWFTTTNGLELLWHYNNEDSITNNDSQPYLIK